MFLRIGRPPRSARFPDTTLFRSRERDRAVQQIYGRGRVVACERTPSGGAEDFRCAPAECDAERRAVARDDAPAAVNLRSEEHTSGLQSLAYLVCRLLPVKKKHTA